MEMFKQKKAISVWVSAILYFGIGLVLISIILAAGMPVVNRLKDKNVAIQTKDVFFTLDETIRTVAREGPGSQRILNVDISKGQFTIYESEDTFNWTYDTTSVLSEPEVDVTEGFLNMRTDLGNQEGKFILKYSLDYSEVDLNITSTKNAISGPTVLTIKNEGVKGELVQINIAEATQF